MFNFRHAFLNSMRPVHTPPPAPEPVKLAPEILKASLGATVTWYDMPILAWMDCSDGHCRLAVAIPETPETKEKLPYLVTEISQAEWEAWKSGAANADLRALFINHTTYYALYEVEDARFHLVPTVKTPPDEDLPLAGAQYDSISTEPHDEPALPLVATSF